PDCRAAGVTVLVGDPSDRELLVKAGILAARRLVVASAEDRRNADVALAAREVASRRRRPLPCYVHVAHAGLSPLLGEAALTAVGEGPLRLEFFNPWEAVPPIVLDEFPPRTSGAGPHMLVVGAGPLGRSLVVHAARRSVADGRRLAATLVGPGASEAAHDLIRRYPRLEQACDLSAQDVRLDAAEFEHGAYLDGLPVTSAYVALDDDASGLEAALRLSRAAPSARVVVLATEHSGLGALVNEIRSSRSPIALFDVLERTARPEILLNGTIELLARAIHHNYVRAQQAAGHTAADNPALRSWEDLPESTKEANRAQAADIGRKLAAVGCRIRPWADWTGDGFRFTPDEVERLAELEHERWRSEKEAEGWTWGPARDDRRKTSPYLVAWAELSEDVKETYNRSAVRALPELLANAGYEIVRAPA
ncbi:MAG: RyR domain-containing protein, partial [Actinomycetota bacterium]|nr:RyR domain-containing protein [Actinomycetota bacterium]